MARLFILFLIALLPLRGWTVQGMAMEMGGMPMAAQAQGLSGHMAGGMSEDCALQMQTASTPAAADASGTTAHKGCQSCQLCMPLAALDAAASVDLGANPQALPASPHPRCISADSARQVKPPIS